MVPIPARDLGLIPYLEARAIQEALIQQRLDAADEGESSDVVLYCEHPAVITKGRRTQAEHLPTINRPTAHAGCFEIPESAPEVIEVRRGGSVTVHLPGQLVIYPVISLPQRRLGVRSFVELGLSTVVDVLGECGLQAEVKLNPAGVWSFEATSRKIAQVGIQMIRGVTNHGFSVNLNCDLKLFRSISPCGLAPELVTNVWSLLGEQKPQGAIVSVSAFALAFHRKFCGKLGFGT